MRKFLLLAIGLLCVNSLLTSCSSNYDPEPTTNNSNVRNPLQGTFTATVNGVTYIANEKTVSDTLIGATRMISITGLSFSADRDPAVFQTISLTIPNYTGTHAYNLNGSEANGQYVLTDSGNVTVLTAFSGDTLAKVTISQAGSNYAGSFNFSAITQGNVQHPDTVTIANGNFNIPR